MNRFRVFAALAAWTFIQGTASADAIVWSDASDSIRIANTDGTGLRTILSSGQGITDLDVDAVGQKVYWTSFGGGLMRANLDGSGVETLVPDIGGDFQIQQVAIDSQRGHVYFKEFDPSNSNGRDSIIRIDLDGANRTVILQDLNSVSGIAVDSLNGKLYFGDSTTFSGNLGTYLVRSADLDGSNVETLLSDLGSVGNLEVDPIAGSLYVTGFDTALRTNLDGMGAQALPLLGSPSGLAIDPAEALYATFRGIFRFDLDGSNAAPIPGLEDLGNNTPFHIAFVGTTVVPEPSSLALGAIGGVIGFGCWWRRRKQTT